MNSSKLTFKQFQKLGVLSSIRERYLEDHVKAVAAVPRLVTDLRSMNRKFDYSIGDQVIGSFAFTAVSGRVKTYESVLRKLYRICRDLEYDRDDLTETVLLKCHKEIKDIAGCRFSCPYIDQVRLAIDYIIRQELNKINEEYETVLKGKIHEDKNFLEHGDKKGYRAFHLYVRVPILDAFGNGTKMLCEIQGRSELQHVWATKSHDLLYKQEEGWSDMHRNTVKFMRRISDSLGMADDSIVIVRNSARGVKDSNADLRIIRKNGE
jgi:ppGpp synthetase/RelA/SpoT-type nucleotidyltranferase